jgi:hypothetical protein
MDLAASLGVARPTVGRWRSRFIERRLGGLVDEDRPGAPRKEDHRRAGGGGGRPGVHPEGCHALVADLDGQALRAVEIHRGPHLYGVSAQAAPVGDGRVEPGPLFVGKARDGVLYGSLVNFCYGGLVVDLWVD